MKSWCWIFCAILAGGCAIGRPDHFHALDSAASKALAPRTGFVIQVSLRVSLPTIVDRDEMVVSRPGGVTVFEHERWAAPLSEQFSSVLGQDIEARRPDVIVTSRSIAELDNPTTTIAVEVVELSLTENSGARMEARWRIGSGGRAIQGRETFVATAGSAGFDGLVAAANDCIGSLADRLVARLPPAK